MIEPVRKTLMVPASPAAAFRRFTAEIGTWWPLRTHSVLGEEAEAVAFGAGPGEAIVERGGGEEHAWGTITAWEPPQRVVFSWHPGRDASTAQRVEVTFEAAESGTRVTLVHTGWETLGEEAAGTREGYDSGWDTVLGQYARSAVAA